GGRRRCRWPAHLAARTTVARRRPSAGGGRRSSRRGAPPPRPKPDRLRGRLGGDVEAWLGPRLRGRVGGEAGALGDDPAELARLELEALVAEQRQRDALATDV